MGSIVFPEIHHHHTMTIPLPPRQTFSKKDREYLQRLEDRAVVLRNRLRGSQLRDTQEVKKELHALEWAVAKLKSMSVIETGA